MISKSNQQALKKCLDKCVKSYNLSKVLTDDESSPNKNAKLQIQIKKVDDKTLLRYEIPDVAFSENTTYLDEIMKAFFTDAEENHSFFCKILNSDSSLGGQLKLTWKLVLEDLDIDSDCSVEPKLPQRRLLFISGGNCWYNGEFVPCP